MSIFLYVSEENLVFNHNNTHLLISAFILALVLPEDVLNLKKSYKSFTSASDLRVL